MKISIKLTSLFVAFLFFTNPSFCKIIYVNSTAINSNNDGSSWQDAYSNFQNAITEAVYGDSIWVAQGTYFPTNDSDRTISFELENGVKWFGGFQGNELEIIQRDFELYPTILSGDIGILNDSIDNSFHVVHSMGVDTSTRIDGFKIVFGQADENSNINRSGGGMYLEVNSFNSITKPKIYNCTFQNNTAKSGGGISFYVGNQNLQAIPHISKCNFYQNKAINSGGTGGAISISGGNINSEEIILIEDCTFENNICFLEGGAISFTELQNTCEINRCNFSNNSTSGSNQFGGAVSFLNTTSNHIGDLSFSDCNFVGNTSPEGGALSIYVLNIFVVETFEFTIKNSVFDSNQINGPGINLGAALDFRSSVKSNRITIDNSKFFNHSEINENSVIRISNNPLTGNENDSLVFNMDGCEFINNNSNALIFSLQPNNSVNYFSNITNSTFIENKDFFSFDKSLEARLDTKINNCSFFKNEGRIIRIDTEDNYSVEIGNSIFWEDLSFTEMFYDFDTLDLVENFNIHHSLLKSPDCIVNGINLCGDGMLFNQYPEFRDTVNGDFSLRSCSPAVNQGDNLSIDTFGILFDLEGNPRFIDQVVDIGAYETQAFESFTPQVQDVSCAGEEDGSVFWVQHGTPPFTFEWDNGMTMGNNMSDLSAGNYSFTVTDADSCTGIIEIEIEAPLPLEVMDTVIHATAMNASDGSINLMLSGGTPEYFFLWENGDTTATLNNLTPGLYQVTVTDANGCSEELEYEVDAMTSIKNNIHNYNIQLLPNISPQGTSANLFFEKNENETFEIKILNELGQSIFYKKLETQAGNNFYKIKTPTSAGLFFIQIKNNEGVTKVLKWVVLR